MSAAAIGGTTLSAGIADSQAQLNQAMGVTAGFGSDSIAQFSDAYRASSGGPTLTFLGFNPFQIVATGGFHALFWSAIVAFLGIMTLVAMQQALRSRYAFSARSPLVVVAQVYFRLLVGVLIISDLPLVYGILMTLNGALSQGVEDMSSGAMSGLLQAGGLGTLTLAQARIDAVRGAAERRAVALYPRGGSRAELVQIGTWYNATAGAINAALAAQNASGQLPVLATTGWSDSSAPDDQVDSTIGRNVVQNFGALVSDLAALPAASGPLSIAFPSGGSSSLSLLSAALANDDAQAAQAMALPDTPSSDAAFESARQLYSRNVLADTLSYLDTQLLPVIGASPTLAQRAKAWFSEKVEQAAAGAAGGFMTEWKAAVDWIGRAIGVVLTRMVAFFFTAATGAMIEIELFMLVVALPFWLLPATEEAFHGVVRSLLALSVAVPAYQFIMLFVDALMGLVLKYAMFGPLASGAPAAGGAAAAVVSAVVAAAAGSELIALVTFCYVTAYCFLAIYAAFKTPKLVATFLKGAGAAGSFLSTFATGLVAGASAALATAAVAGGGGGGLAARLLAGGGRPPAASAAGSPRPAPGRFRYGPAQDPAPRAPRPAPSAQSLSPQQPISPRARAERPVDSLREAAGFGLRTFTDCLGADSPGEGFRIAMHALEAHRRRKEKETTTRHRPAPTSPKSISVPPSP